MFTRKTRGSELVRHEIQYGQPLSIDYHTTNKQSAREVISYISKANNTWFVHLQSKMNDPVKRIQIYCEDGKAQSEQFTYWPSSLEFSSISIMYVIIDMVPYEVHVDNDEGQLVYFKTEFTDFTKEVQVGDIFIKQGFSVSQDEKHKVIAISGNKETLFMENIETGVAIAVKSNDLGLIAKFRDLQSETN